MITTGLITAVITFLRVEATNGLPFTEYEYPVVTNSVTNVFGHWPSTARKVSLTWQGQTGRTYWVESASTPGARPATNGWDGEAFHPCSLPMPGAANMGWTSGVPGHIRFFRVRSL